jgi:hypothetical protein
MKETPILFSTPMVQAILDDRKTQTRRVVKPQPVERKAHDGYKFLHIPNTGAVDSFVGNKCPYGQVGDVVWVRETWQHSLNPNEYCYKADTDNPIYLDKNWKWKPSLHMPKAACRLFLKITNIKVERLQDISEDDAVVEGVEKHLHGFKKYTNHNPSSIAVYDVCMKDAKSSFETLWQSINGAESWNNNPWVWVIEFQKL